MNHLSLFSGIGGLDLAAEWAGFRTVGFVERDRYCQRVLAKHWPGVPIWDDVAEVTANPVGIRSPLEQDRDIGVMANSGNEKEAAGNNPAVLASTFCSGNVHLISGGFPCQPHSVAGLRRASADERDLWGECARIVGEFRPRWAVFENVPGLLTSERGTFFARVLGDLAALGYRVGWCVYGAVDVGAPHRRERVFIVANAADNGRDRRRFNGTRIEANGSTARAGDMADADGERGCVRQTGRQDAEDAGQSSRGACGRRRQSQSRLGDLVDGLPRWLVGPGLGWGEEPNVSRVAAGVKDRVNKLRALGNAVVPAQAFPIFRAIADIEGMP